MLEKQMFRMTNVFSIKKKETCLRIVHPQNPPQTYTLETNGWNLSHCSPKDLPFLFPLSVVNMGFHQQPGRRYAFVVAPEQSHLAEVHAVSCVTGECH